jgi:hypothetical protein
VRYPPALLADGDAALNHPDAHVGAVGTAKGPMATLFLARTHVIFDSLMPLLLNVRAVVGKEEFLSRERDAAPEKTRDGFQGARPASRDDDVPRDAAL